MIVGRCNEYNLAGVREETASYQDYHHTLTQLFKALATKNRLFDGATQSQHTDFNEDKTNESAMACSHVRL